MHLEHFLRPLGDYAALILGVAALVFAFVQLRHSRHLIRDAARIVDGTEVIANALSTRFIGEFPKNMRTILEVLRDATSHVEILVDIVAYGHYSSPDSFLAYRQQLEALGSKPDIELRMVVHGPRLTDASRRAQFKADEFPKLQQTDLYLQFTKKKREPKSYEEFIQLLLEEEKSWDDHMVKQGAKIFPAEEPFPFFLWLVDGREAVFSFQTYGEHYHEICFRTRDGNLVKAFSDLFNANLSKSPTATLGACVASPTGQR
jgi:hypothetical protein